MYLNFFNKRRYQVKVLIITVQNLMIIVISEMKNNSAGGLKA